MDRNIAGEFFARAGAGFSVFFYHGRVPMPWDALAGVRTMAGQSGRAVAGVATQERGPWLSFGSLGRMANSL
jgi:hypothetical protein